MPPLIARIPLDVPLPKLLDYLADGLSQADLGRRVKVPFGRKEQVGVLLELADTTDCPAAKLKRVIEVDRNLPALAEDVLILFRFCADYYHYPIGQIALSALPTAMRRWQFQMPKATSLFVLTPEGRRALPDSLPSRAFAQRRVATRLADGAASSTELATLCTNASQLLQSWQDKGWVKAQRQDASAPKSASLLKICGQCLRALFVLIIMDPCYSVG